MAARGKIGGFARAAKYSAGELTGPARQGFLKRFEPKDEDLSAEERLRRSQAALNSHMARLARLSAVARSKRK